MKEIGYRIFAIVFYICRIFPVSSKKVFLVMTHDKGDEGNVAVVRKFLEMKKDSYVFHTLIRSDTQFGKSIKKLFRFFFLIPFHMATSSYIFLDNIFLPMGYMSFSKKVKVVQLWHGTGTVKKFGQSVNIGNLKKLEAHANQVTTHLIVNGKGIQKQYAECFGMPQEKVYPIGMPRTDFFFQPKSMELAKKKFYQQYPECKGKKLVLYAPTFRDGQEDHPDILFDYEKISRELGEGYIIGLRLHPFVSKNFHLSEYLGTRVIDFSKYESLNTLLSVTNILISDYSSVIFEFSVLRRKMIFFAYDLEEFSQNGRGFYHDYQSYVPGPVVKTNEELIKEIQNPEYEKEKVEKFVKDSFTFEDGKSTQRLYDLLGM